MGGFARFGQFLLIKKRGKTMKNKTEKKLTIRSKILVKCTTNPANMGYDGRPDSWENIRGTFTSPRIALDFNRKISQQIGQGTYLAIKYFWNGNEISLGEIMDIVDAVDFKKWGRK